MINEREHTSPNIEATRIERPEDSLLVQDTKKKLIRMKSLLPRNINKTTFLTGKLPIYSDRDTRVLALYDNHFPFDLYTDSILQVNKDNKFDYIILGGDNIDNTPFNHWQKEKPAKAKQLPNARDYFDFCNEEFYKPLREAVGKKTPIIHIIGNHEQWSERAIDQFPDGEGFWEVYNNIKSEYIDYWVENKKLISLGKLSFGHGDNMKENKNHALKLPQFYHRNLMYGHYHDFQVRAIDVAVDEEPIRSFSTPCLTNLNPSYNKNQPNNHSWGFNEVVIKPNGDFFVTTHEIKNGEFIFNGKTYKSKMTEGRKLGYRQ